MAVRPESPDLTSDAIGPRRRRLTYVPARLHESLRRPIAAGYTLAAGPVRAGTIETGTPTDLKAGDAKVPVAGGDIPIYYARPANVANPPVILVRDGDLRPARVGEGHHAAADGASRRLGDRARLLPAWAINLLRGHADVPKLLPLVEQEAGAPNCLPSLDATVAWAESTRRRRTDQLGIMELLPRRPHRVGYTAHNPKTSKASGRILQDSAH